MTIKNFKLTIEYDGSAYHGWQRQANGPTIQQEIETAIEKMTRQRVVLIGSGRTDAGVHARGQVANFQCPTRIPPEAFHKGLNSLLPDDIVIRECLPVAIDFHARYHAKSKLYRYTILNSPFPIAVGRQYAWWLHAPLDICAMQAAARHFIGRHDFKAFEATGSPREHTVRQVTRAALYPAADQLIHFEIEANGFLRCMVRNITGTLVMIGQQKLAAESVPAILSSRNRQSAGMTAPPQGLCLETVTY